MNENSTACQLYAEVLRNIRQLTVYATLSLASSSTTTARVDATENTFALFHNGETTTLKLPASVNSLPSPTIPDSPAQELSFRFRLSHHAPGTQEHDNAVPWSASDLSAATAIHCQNCNQLVLPFARIAAWKDLPSDNWAEMMDFWHCHKPDVKHDDADWDTDETGATKGYAAGNKLSAQTGVGLVSQTYLLVAQDDCVGIKHQSHPDPTARATPEALHCAVCSSPLGAVDDPAIGYRLYKWGIALSSPAQAAPSHSHPTSVFISAQLLALIDSQGVKKFTVRSLPTTEDNPSLLVWVFNPSVRVSSSRLPRPMRAMKIFYQSVAPCLSAAEDRGADLSTEEVVLPLHVLAYLVVTLHESGELLPASARKLGEWNVGLLERWDPDVHG